MQVSGDAETIGEGPKDRINVPERGRHGIRRNDGCIVRGDDNDHVGCDSAAAIGHNGRVGRRIGTACGDVAARERRGGPGTKRDRSKQRAVVARLAAEHEDVIQCDVAGVADRSSEGHDTAQRHRAWRATLRHSDGWRGGDRATGDIDGRGAAAYILAEGRDRDGAGVGRNGVGAGVRLRFPGRQFN